MKKQLVGTIKVDGQMAINGSISLIAEETNYGIIKGHNIVYVSKKTWNAMKSPKQVNLIRNKQGGLNVEPLK